MSAVPLAETVRLAALDARVVLLPLVLGLGLYLLLMAQPIGRPRPDLGERLRRLDVDERIRLAELGRQTMRPLFASRLLENMLRPVVKTPAGCCGRCCSAWGSLAGTSWRRVCGCCGRALRWCSSWVRRSPPA